MKTQFYQGHVARKRFGQNFLHDTAIIDSIVSAINPKPDQPVIEIGPGLGALTLPVAKRIPRLTLIELDRDLAARLQAHPDLAGKITLCQQDALDTDYQQLADQLGTPLRIFGNLPYNISTPLMFHLFRFSHLIADMHFMLQKEVVDRLLATRGGQNYGRLSVMTQYHCKVTSVLNVPPTSFTPPPQVNSEVVRLVPHPRPPYPVSDLRLLSRLVAMAFNQRRKTIRNSLAALITVAELNTLNIDPALRAQNITLEQYCRLANHIAQHPTKRHD